MGIARPLVASFEALTQERDTANQMAFELVDILRAALIDRLTVDHGTEAATRILDGHLKLPAGYPDWVTAAMTKLTPNATGQRCPRQRR